MIHGKERSRMVMIALCSSLVGAVLGTRFRVLVLFPAALIGFVTIAVVAALKGAAVSSATLAVVLLVTSLQLGYVGGIFTRYCMVASRVALPRSLRSKTARS